MRRTKRLLIVCCIAWAAMFMLTEEPIFAHPTCSDAIIASGSSCGCSGWMTLVWDGAWGSCMESSSEDELCAAGVCSLVCGGPLHTMGTCQNNQWSSWVGFRCGYACP